MKAARAKMGRMLSINTKKEGGDRRKIRFVTEEDVAKVYRLQGQVMESTNTGMEVLWATRLADNLQCVVKTRDKKRSFKSGHDEQEWRCTTECQLNMPKVECLCELYEVLETKDRYIVVMEKVEGQDLYETMAKETVTHSDARDIIRQIMEALKILHGEGRIHKDLKIENVMVDITSPKNKATLIDFDTVQDWEPTSPRTKDVLGTDGYIAPEAYSGEYSPASDVYSVGVMMYKLITGKFPSRPDIFDDKPGENWVGSPAMKRIQDRLMAEKIDYTLSPLDNCPEAADLLSKLLAFELSERLSAEDALKHPWFLVDKSKLSDRTRRRSSRSGASGTLPL